MEKKIDWKEFKFLIESEIKGSECIVVNQYLGSMLYLDFGILREQESSILKRKYFSGESIISIRGCYWDFWKNDDMILSSDNIDAQNKFLIIDSLLKKKFNTIENDLNSNTIVFKFYEGYSIDIDISNKWDIDGNAAEFRSKAGYLINISRFGDLTIEDEC